MESRRFGITVCLLSALAVHGVGGRCDDWPQFRRDSGHSALSKDKVDTPLREVWKWDQLNPDGSSPVYHAVVWKDRVFFTGGSSNGRVVVCADLGTGKVYWSRPLSATHLRFALSEAAGPAVSASGRVFVYDWFTQQGVQSRTGLIHKGQELSSSGIVEPVNSFCVRTFDAMTGDEGSFFPLAAMGANGVLPRLSLLEGVRGQAVRPVPPTFAGCPP
jgi:outer membrane protein assembly factor BamB